MTRIALTLLVTGLALTGCGRLGPPRAPGPAQAITYPGVYPALTREDRISINASRAAAGLPPFYLIAPE